MVPIRESRAKTKNNSFRDVPEQCGKHISMRAAVEVIAAMIDCFRAILLNYGKGPKCARATA